MRLDIRDHIRTIQDFPKPGIRFYDISTVLSHAQAWRAAIDQLAAGVAPYRPDLLAGIESRGFLMAAPLALHMGKGFIMIRKQGKLPGRTVSHSYALEYGEDTMEVQDDAVSPGQRIVVVDDILATGGTMAASIALLRKVGGVVAGAACLIELTFLEGRRRIDVPLFTAVSYDR